MELIKSFSASSYRRNFYLFKSELQNSTLYLFWEKEKRGVAGDIPLPTGFESHPVPRMQALDRKAINTIRTDDAILVTI